MHSQDGADRPGAIVGNAPWRSPSHKAPAWGRGTRRACRLPEFVTDWAVGPGVNLRPAMTPDTTPSDPADDVLELLTLDHDDVREWFDEYEDLVDDGADDETRLTLALRICNALTAHAAAEEEVFYPAVRAALGEEDEVDEAESEHAAMKELIGQIQSLDPSDDRFDSTVAVLSELVRRHVQEEEGEIFPRVRDSQADLQILAEQVAAVREDVLASLAESSQP